MNIPDLSTFFPISDPTLIFFVVLCVILLAPMLLNRLHIPHIIGMLLAGVLIGPHGLEILQRDSSFEIFGNVGLLYIMFLAGVEIDLGDFNKNKNKSITFGLFTFAFPFSMGCMACHYLLHMDWMAAILMASMFSSHTLVSYAIARRYGVTRNLAVNMAVGGTMITDTLSLLVLAIISRSVQGHSDMHFWIIMCVSIIVYASSVLYLFPRIARFFFRRVNDQILQFVFVLSMLFLAAIGAHAAGMEGILGAFLAGIALNRLIPPVSPLMNRLEFMGNALFIPYFLIGVGMLIDIRVFFKGAEALEVAGVMTVIATLGKFIGAWCSSRIFKMRNEEGIMLFGLSSAHTAATLAVVMVGYKLGLFNESVLNGTLVLILITCIISSFAVEKASRKLAMGLEREDENSSNVDKGRCLIGYFNPETVDDLTQIALLIRDKKKKDDLIGLSVVYDNEQNSLRQKQGKINLEKATQIAASADVSIRTLSRVGTNITSGIIHTMQENDVTEVVLGMHRKSSIVDTFNGHVLENLLKSTHRQVMVVRCMMPVNTLQRIVVAVPPKAEYEPGFHRWVTRLCRMGEQLACRIHFFAHPATLHFLRQYMEKKYKDVRTEYSVLDDWEDLLLLTAHVSFDYLLVIITARRGFISYDPSFEKLPLQVSRYFNNCSLMFIYPDQNGEPQELVSFAEPGVHDDTGRYSQVDKWFNHWFKGNNG